MEANNDDLEFPVAFELEKYFDKYYGSRYMLSGSDAEALTLPEMLEMADPQCLDMWHNMKMSYTERGGNPMVLHLAADIHSVRVEDVLEIVPQEGIYIAMQVLVKYLKNKYGTDHLHAVATFPAYQSLHENLRLLQCDLDYWTVRDAPDGWRFDLDDLKTQLRDDTRILVVNFPHNPTGALPTATEWEALLDMCKQRGIFLFSDEMYRLSNLDATPPLSSACAVYDDAISLFGVSKTLALASLRIGWVCTRNDPVMAAMRRYKDYTTICGPYPSEVLSIIALRNCDKIVQRTVSICNTNLKIVDAFVKEFPDLFGWKPPKACTTGFLQIKGWLLELGRGGATGFCEVLVEKTGILMLPSSVYGYKPDAFVRFGFGRLVVPEALDVLKKFIKDNRP